LAERASVDERKEVAVRVDFHFDDRVFGADRWGID